MATTPRTVLRKTDDGLGTFFSDGTVMIKNVRASYPHVIVPGRAFVGADGKPGERSYSITGMMPKATHGKVASLLGSIMKDMLAEAKIPGVKADAKFLRDGDLSGKDDYVGHWTVSAREKLEKPPRVLEADAKTPIVGAENAKRIYGGCWVSLLIRPWLQNNGFGKRINANLVGVQFLRNDEPFGDGSISTKTIDDSFDNMATEADWADDDNGL